MRDGKEHRRWFLRSLAYLASKDKRLKVVSGNYFTTAMLPKNIELQLRFFDRYLKGIENGWEKEPRVEVSIGGADDSVTQWFADTQWPLSGTRWT